MHKKILLAILFVLLFCNKIYAAHTHPEKYYQEQWCNANSGIMEYKLDDATRIDCLTPEYAIEFGFVDHKYEDIGQSLYYSLKTGKKPAIATIIENSKTAQKHLNILKEVCNAYGIQLIIIEP